MKIAKFLILGVAVVVGVVIALNLTGCKKDSPSIDDVDGVMQTDGAKQYITKSDYESLADLYASNREADEAGNPDTTGFYDYISSLLTDNGYNPAEVLPPAVPVKVLPSKAVVYLDNTASMLGYLKPATLSPNLLVDILNGISGNYGSDVEAYYVNNKDLEMTNLDELITKLNGKKVATYDAYPMNEFIKTIVDKCNADTAYNVINFFLTDAIPSGTNEEIRTNPEFNHEQKSTLERRINQALDNADNYGLSVYAFDVNFDGKYINYTNNKKGSTFNYKGTRPVYLIALGDKDLVAEFKGKAEKGEVNYFNPTKMLHSIKAYSNNGGVSVSGVGHGAAERIEGNNFKLPEDVKEYSVNLSLNDIPEYLISADDIANPAVELPLTITINGEDKTAALRANNNISYDKDANMLLIKAVKGDNPENTMVITFNHNLPHWVSAATCEEDLNINDHANETFNLDIVLNGLVRGINNLTGKTLGEPIKLTVLFD